MIELVMEVTSLRSSHTRSYDLKISHSQIRPLPSRIVISANLALSVNQLCQHPPATAVGSCF